MAIEIKEKRVRGWLSIITNVLLIFIIALWLIKRAPKIYESYSLETRTAPIFNMTNLNGQSLALPQVGKKTVFIFWATWCGPCTLELARVNRMIEEKVIQPDSIVAISMNEDPKLIQKIAKERKYLFQLAQDSFGEAISFFNVVGTPTVVFLDSDRKIKWVTSGISPTLEARMRSFLKE